MDDRQWIATTAFGGIVVSAFLNMPVIGGMATLLIVAMLQGAYLGWQTVPTSSQFKVGLISFALGVFVGMPVTGVLISPTGPGKLWGMAAAFAIIIGLATMIGVRFFRSKQTG